MAQVDDESVFMTMAAPDSACVCRAATEGDGGAPGAAVEAAARERAAAGRHSAGGGRGEARHDRRVGPGGEVGIQSVPSEASMLPYDCNKSELKSDARYWRCKPIPGTAEAYDWPRAQRVSCSNPESKPSVQAKRTTQAPARGGLSLWCVSRRAGADPALRAGRDGARRSGAGPRGGSAAAEAGEDLSQQSGTL